MALIKSISTTALSCILLGSLFAYWVAYIVHTSRKARLDHVPGPFLARYTNAWRCYQAWRQNGLENVQNYQMKAHRRYGDVVRVGPNNVVVSDPEAIPHIYGIKERLNKGPGYAAIVQPGAKQAALLPIVDEEMHGRFRRPVAHAYSLSSIKGYEPYIDDTINTLVGILDQHAKTGKPIALHTWLGYWSFDTVAKISFGREIGFLNSGHDVGGMTKAHADAFRYFHIMSQMPALDYILRRNPAINYVKGTKPTVIVQFARNAVQERLQSLKDDPEANKKDMLGSFMASASRYPDVMTIQQITAYCTANILAGASTTSNVISRSTRFIAKHPEAWERMHREISNSVPESLDADSNLTDGPVALDLAIKVPYMEAFVTESFRLFSTEPTILERVVASGGMILPNGITLPPGAIVGMNAATILMREDVFGSETNNYNPLRWLRRDDETEGEFKTRRAKMDRAMIAFGAGSRSCIGKNIVLLELYKLWATLARLYTFEAMDTNKGKEVIGFVKVHRRYST